MKDQNSNSKGQETVTMKGNEPHIKVVLGSKAAGDLQVRRFRQSQIVDGDRTILVKLLAEVTGIPKEETPSTFWYKDDEGDRVFISTSQELLNAISLQNESSKKTLKLIAVMGATRKSTTTKRAKKTKSSPIIPLGGNAFFFTGFGDAKSFGKSCATFSAGAGSAGLNPFLPPHRGSAFSVGVTSTNLLRSGYGRPLKSTRRRRRKGNTVPVQDQPMATKADHRDGKEKSDNVESQSNTSTRDVPHKIDQPTESMAKDTSVGAHSKCRQSSNDQIPIFGMKTTSERATIEKDDPKLDLLEAADKALQNSIDEVSEISRLLRDTWLNESNKLKRKS